MPSATVNGVTLHYEVVGAGPTCLVVPGWIGADHTYLRPALDRLAAFLRLVYYDHRGTGRSAGSWPESLTVERLAEDAGALARHVGDGPVLVLGHFHGATVAQELALRHPRQVAGLVLVAATPGQLGTQESLLDGLGAVPTPPEVEVLQRVPPATDEELAATMHALAPFFFHDATASAPAHLFSSATFSAATAVQAMVALGWWSAVDRLGHVDVPTLVLVGRHDVFAPPFESERVARNVSGARLRVLEGSGHVPWLEEPEAFVASVQDWLDDESLSE